MKKLFNPSRIITFCSAITAVGIAVISLEGCKKETKNLLVENQGYLTCKASYAQHIYNNGVDTTNSVNVSAGASFIDGNGNTIPAGSVSINGNVMDNTDVVGQYNYGLSNQAEDFFSGGAVFSISGSDQIKAFSQDAGALIPFRMTLPYTMIKSAGISFTLDIPSTFSYSEVRVTIGDKDDNRVYETFNSANISIPSSAFNNLTTADGENSYILVEVLRKQTTKVNGEEVNFVQSVLEQHPLDIQ